MSARALGAIAAGVIAVLVLCAGGIGALFTSGGAASAVCYGPTGPDGQPPLPTLHVSPPTFSAGRRWSSDQTANAALIVTVGEQRKVPPRGWVIALATAMQESTLRNLPGGDRDSVGLFQQRPSQGWGTPAQLRDPRYAAEKFYTALLAVDGWQAMALTDAAQAVQRSAYPDAYAKWEDDAIALVRTMGSANPSVGSGGAAGCADVAAVFARARSWLTAWSGGPVPYLSSGNPGDWFQGYRRDCSGYVSMALGLDGPGLNTAGLAARSTVIAKNDLRPGDLLINTAPDLRGHVVLFERWSDPSMSHYYGYEQSGDGGTHHRLIPYPYFGDYPMIPHRYGRTG
ncbi:NlpC/P60 family protein [Micromonospora sp. NPDC049051]|uniref:NlpC/P60 family protein n=1 Tax=Micromonospora sp. NPDC049051 TaxID=3364264 RepID=UPI003710C855